MFTIFLIFETLWWGIRGDSPVKITLMMAGGNKQIYKTDLANKPLLGKLWFLLSRNKIKYFKVEKR